MEKTRRSARTVSSTIIVRPAPGRKSRALIQCGPFVFPAAIGRSGRTILKREGDGATPIASMKLLYGFCRGKHPSRLKTPLPIRRIRDDMLWCDQPGDPNYNRLVRAPFRKSHEEMKRKDGLYDICLVMDWNITSRARNRGSAIFFHLIGPGYQPTAGCLAIHPRDMRRLLPHMRKGTVIRVV
ncbi:L,D-transpeptidase domain-containing protein [Rhizobium etli 8C-3]|uniref:L,D-peptidoglycan transpeptidase YkuD (ErfK/YbiS/YcfS/YnhG family) n=2 Tax=Rhizobium TaxID=379 RepID=A0A4R3RMT3_9HYPH|nr:MULTISPECIES: L,D-transpeptidase [Rhizobium]APO76706.1 L,D-transpeptidase domain-containing protein [Rhizobium etli 8C-3]TCU23895.1 L,D-peptidoglycan transpeptidase YkuD (ErfK/YbiS/YcfS/YnhG family) [Rhizobium azibense]TCU36164.1 L,D-peptidoglycan transpeptidase YkuD (ErfK/YbiS/YcfS/YnhG family) [Rhizobium azibense]